MAPSVFCVVSSIKDIGNLFQYSPEYIDNDIKNFISNRKMYQFFNIYKSDIQIVSHTLRFLNICHYFFIFIAFFILWNIWDINTINFFIIQFFFSIYFLILLLYCGIIIFTIKNNIKLFTYVQYEYLKFNSKTD